MGKIKLADLQPDSRNFNKHTQKGMGLLEKSMQKFGFVEAGLISEDNVICSGNARQETAVMIGMDEVQIVEIDGSKPVYLKKKGLQSNTKEFHELALVLNNVAKENIVFDAEVIEAVLEEAVIEEWGVELPEDKHLEAEEDDYSYSDTVQTDIVLGDLFEIGNHRLLCGDSTNSDDIVKLMDGKKASMVLTDPPYEIEIDYANIVLVADNANVFIFNNDRNLVNQLKQSPLTFKKFFVFNHNACAIPQEGGNEVFLTHILISHETIGEAPKYIKGAGTRTVIAGEYRKSELHKHEKPNGLIADIITPYTKQGDLICDLFLGSGSTMATCEQINRACYGMELEPKSCQIIVDRMLKLKPDIKVLRNGEKYLHNSLKVNNLT